jgi:hypothetical protein
MWLNVDLALVARADDDLGLLEPVGFGHLRVV